MSASDFFREAGQERPKRLSGQSERFSRFFRSWLFHVAGVAKLPSILSERHERIHNRFEARVDGQAQFADFLKAMCLSKRLGMPDKESLERLFGCLLAVEKEVLEQWRLSQEGVLGSPEIRPGPVEPRPCFRHEGGVMRHRAICLPGL